MDAIQTYADYTSLRGIIQQAYAVNIDQVNLHREMIGYVYFASNNTKRYVLKLYRPLDTENALRSIQIIQYLKKNDYPVVSIVPTGAGELHTIIHTPQGPSIAILYDFIEGTEPNLDTEMLNIGCQVGRLHRIMEAYPRPILRRGKEFYIDRYTAILRELNYPASRIEEMERYGRELWQRFECLPGGFCHGDLHSGNMLQTGPGKYVLFDFDIASRTCSLIDVTTICDGSDFNRFDARAYDRTLRIFERFYPGYRTERELTNVEIAAMFDFIAIRHYEIIATIAERQGLDCLSRAFLDEQFEWLMNWKNVCDRNAQRITGI